jgi:hypothetical protein
VRQAFRVVVLFLRWSEIKKEEESPGPRAKIADAQTIRERERESEAERVRDSRETREKAHAPR